MWEKGAQGARAHDYRQAQGLGQGVARGHGRERGGGIDGGRGGGGLVQQCERKSRGPEQCQHTLYGIFLYLEG